jgi:hypothetical protein
MGWLSDTKGSDGDYNHRDKHNSIPKGLIPKLAKAEDKAAQKASAAELEQLRTQNRLKNRAARKGWN